MRTKFIIISSISVLLFYSCSDYLRYSDFRISTGKKRSEAMSDRFPFMTQYRDTTAYNAFKDSLEQKQEYTTYLDTFTYLAGVEFPDGYDWMKDSNFGHIQGKIILFRNGERIMEMNAGEGTGISLDADQIFLLGKNIITISRTTNEASFLKNGVVIGKLDKNESLKGLICFEDHIYSLWQESTDGGICLRKDGDRIYYNDRGFIKSDMSDRTFSSSGALHKDNGRFYFTFYQKTESGNGWYMVSGAKETMICTPDRNTELLDAIMIESEPYLLIRNLSEKKTELIHGDIIEVIPDYPGYIISEAFLGNNNGDATILLRLEQDNNQPSAKKLSCLWAGGILSNMVSGHPDLLVRNRKQVELYRESDSSIQLRNAEGRTFHWESVYFPGAQGVFFDGAGCYLILNPRNNGGKAILWNEGKTQEINLNGYLCGVDVVVNKRL